MVVISQPEEAGVQKIAILYFCRVLRHQTDNCNDKLRNSTVNTGGGICKVYSHRTIRTGELRCYLFPTLESVTYSCL